MTNEQFLALFPEFRTAESATLTATLAAAELLVSDTWGAQRNLVVGLHTASWLHCAPQGRNARLDGTINDPYAKSLLIIKRAHGCAFNRVG